MLRNLNKWMQNYIQKLKIRVPRQSTALSKSIKGKLSDNGDMEFTALDYFAYQDEGVSGTKVKRNTPFTYREKMPPISAFKAYSKTLGGQYAIAKSIQLKGIKPNNFFKDKMEEDFADIPEAILSDIWGNFKLK